MKKPLFSFVLSMLIYCSTAQEAEQEWTTHYAEKVGFQIDMPDDWTTGFSEAKTGFGFYGAAMSAFKPISEDKARVVVLLSSNYKPKALKKFTPPIEDDLKWWKKRSEKDARKSSDSAYKWIDQSLGSFPNEDVKYAWNEYIYTYVSESGEKIISRTREAFLYLKGSMKFGTPRYMVQIKFISPVEDWDKAWEEFESILMTFAPYEP